MRYHDNCPYCTSILVEPFTWEMADGSFILGYRCGNCHGKWRCNRDLDIGFGSCWRCTEDYYLVFEKEMSRAS